MPVVRQSDRAFGLTFAAVFTIVSVVGWVVFDARFIWAPALAAAFLVVALAAPWILMPLNRLWARFAHRLGFVNNFLLLSFFFFVIFFPLGVALRLLGKDPMFRTYDDKAESYWTPVGRQCGRDTLADMF